MTPDDLRRTASACRRVLEPVADADWDARAGELEWSCRETLVHMLTALTYYAVNLATRSTEPRSSGHADPALPLEELLDALEGRAAVLAELCATAPPGVRGAHGWGMADASGFAALACNELLIHTSDVAGPLGASFDPPRETCAGVLARLFPWAPGGRDAWETLRWANGRAPLGDRPRLRPDWVAHPAPLDEWDGVVPNVASEFVDLRLDDRETDEAEAGGYRVRLRRGPGEPEQARLTERVESVDARHTCSVALTGPDGTLLLHVAVRHEQLGGPAVVFFPANGLLLIGAGERLLCYHAGELGPRRLWEDQTVGFTGWRVHGQVILMSAEVELRAFDLRGAPLWSNDVWWAGPPEVWSFVIGDDGMVQVTDEEGRAADPSFPLLTGPDDEPDAVRAPGRRP